MYEILNQPAKGPTEALIKLMKEHGFNNGFTEFINDDIDKDNNNKGV